MTVQSAQSVTALFSTRVFATGVGTIADSLPTGVLYLNGTANGATVTVTNISGGLYKAQVTLPTLTIGDLVSVSITATVSGVTDTTTIWGDTKDLLVDGSGDVTFNNSSIGSVTAAVAITSNRKKGATATFEFTMVDATTGADKTGLTVASQISKDGGSFGSTANVVTEIALGWYQLVLTNAEMTANNISLQMTSTGASNRDVSVQTQP